MKIWTLVVDGDEISVGVYATEQAALDSLRDGWLSEEDGDVSDLDLLQYLIDAYGISLHLQEHTLPDEYMPNGDPVRRCSRDGSRVPWAPYCTNCGEDFE